MIRKGTPNGVPFFVPMPRSWPDCNMECNFWGLHLNGKSGIYLGFCQATI